MSDKRATANMNRQQVRFLPFASSSGSSAAAEAADVVLMRSDFGSVAEAVRTARSAMRTARQNIALALGVKALVLMLGLVGMASMWLAVFADTGVALLCVLNAVRMLRADKKGRQACCKKS
jgi:Cd2+/Zn2+-exporting ATPase